MSTFHEKLIATKGCVTCLAWKTTSPSYFAVGFHEGNVAFYWSDGSDCGFPSLSYQSRTCKARQVVALLFHPTADLLAVIWSDGVMRSWNSQKGVVSNQMSPHSVRDESFLHLKFNHNGTQLISADHRGVISIWRCTIDGALTMLCTFKLKHGCSHVTIPIHHNEVVNDTDDDDEDVKVAPFFLCDSQGKLYVTTASGHCDEVLQLDTAECEDTEHDMELRLLQCMPEYNKLVIITQAMMLSIYDIEDNADDSTTYTLSLHQSYKLAIQCADHRVNCLHLFHGLIAICNEQASIRIFDVIHNENYVLSLLDPRHMAAPNDTIDTIRFLSSTKVLLGITNKQRIVLWKYKYSRRQHQHHELTENDWTVLPPINLQQRICRIDGGLSSQFCHSNEIAIAVVTAPPQELHRAIDATTTVSSLPLSTDDQKASSSGGELKVFCETQLHYRYRNGYTFIQFAPNRLLICFEEKMKKIRTPFTILIVASAANLVFLSNREQAQLYRIERDSAPSKLFEWSELQCSVACLRALCNTEETIDLTEAAAAAPSPPAVNIVACYRQHIKIYNGQGSIKATLTFQEYEGCPVAMDISRSMLAVVTTANVLKIWDLSGGGDVADANSNSARMPKLIVPQRKLEEIVNGVRSIKFNATSTKLSLLLSADAANDEDEDEDEDGDAYINTIYVYDIDKDEFATFKLEPHLSIEDHFWEHSDGRFFSVLFRKIALQPKQPQKRRLLAGGDGGDSSDGNESQQPVPYNDDDGMFIDAGHNSTQNTTAKDVGDSDSESESEYKLRVSSAFRDRSNRLSEAASACGEEPSTQQTSETVSSGMKNTRRTSMLEMTNSELAAAPDIDYGVISFFIAPDGVIMPQEMFPTKWRFVGLHVPDFIFVSVPHAHDYDSHGREERENNSNVNSNTAASNPKVIRKRIRDFIGINNIDDATKHNLMDFSYYLTVGDLDEAYRSVQSIKSASVWQNMARMCVKTRRLDVAQICIANLSTSRGTSATIASSLFVDDDDEDGNNSNIENKENGTLENDEDKHLQLAMVAVDLKMYEDAEELLKQCDRYDLVVKMYQALGRWPSAIEICERYDRVNLNACYYKYAQYLQESGKIENAIEYYEKCDCGLQIASMLYRHQQMSLLQTYVDRCKNPKLLTWYAQFLESNEEYDAAMPYYDKIGDVSSMVRLCCELGDVDKAEKLLLQQTQPPQTKSPSLASSAKGAAYHLASYYEEQGVIEKAIEHYKTAHAYHHALRLAQEHNLDELLIDIALKTPDSVLTARCNPKEIAARYFEENGELSKAVMLYEKSGNINKAMDVCIEGRLFDELRNIASSLTVENGSGSGSGYNLDPSIALRFSEYFMQHQQHEKAVSMLIIATEYEKAIHVVSNYGISLTAELTEKLTPSKTDSMAPSQLAQRKEILMSLAKVLCEQQQYQLACKKYTQCGEKLLAIKCLIKAGDTKKVIQYASKTKNMDTYILAANYLQSLDWHSNAELTKHILQFYNAAKAHEQLAFFYDACAQIEIDDYRDYDKALRALKQSHKQLKKSESANKKEKMDMFEQRIDLVQRFSSARQLAEHDANQMIAICQELIRQQQNGEIDLEAAVRCGDVFALMVEYYFSVNEMSSAYNVMQQMKDNQIELNPYLDAEMMQTVCEHVGVDITQLQLEKEYHEQIADEVIDDEIDDL